MSIRRRNLIMSLAVAQEMNASNLIVSIYFQINHFLVKNLKLFLINFIPNYGYTRFQNLREIQIYQNSSNVHIYF